MDAGKVVCSDKEVLKISEQIMVKYSDLAFVILSR